MRALSRSNRPCSPLMYCELNVLFPSTSIPFRCFAEAKLITFSDTPFELANVIFKQPLYSFRPRAFQVLLSPPRLAVDHDRLEQNGPASSRLPYPAIVRSSPLPPPRSHTSPSVLVCAEQGALCRPHSTVASPLVLRSCHQRFRQ